MIMKKSWKNRSAVSPVIATILMVAITVVLAAVLYVMVIGFNNGGTQTPTVSLTQTDAPAADEYKVYVLTVSGGDVKLANVEAIVTNGALNSTTPSFVVAGTTHTNLEAGDYILVKPTAGATSCSVLLKDTSSGNTLGQYELNL